MNTQTETTLCSGCGDKFPRQRGETSKTCLGCETSTRLETAGVRPGNQGLVRIGHWNTIARQRAGVT